MTEQLKLKLNDSKATRWGALVIVAFTMMAAYYVNDVVAPLKTMLESDLAWTSSDFGFFTGGYSFLNVFFLMLICSCGNARTEPAKETAAPAKAGTVQRCTAS